MKKSFLERSVRHLIPCTIGAFMGGVIFNVSLVSILLAIPISIVLATFITGIFKLDKNEEV